MFVDASVQCGFNALKQTIFDFAELKQALKQLENNNPEAYDEFIRTLHPHAGSVAIIKPSQVKTKPCQRLHCEAQLLQNFFPVQN